MAYNGWAIDEYLDAELVNRQLDELKKGPGTQSDMLPPECPVLLSMQVVFSRNEISMDVSLFGHVCRKIIRSSISYCVISTHSEATLSFFCCSSCAFRFFLIRSFIPRR